MIVFSNSKSYELTAIDKIMENNSLLLRDIFRRYMNILYSTIIVINKFEIDGISFNFNKSEMFEKTLVWQEFKENIDASELKYFEEIHNIKNKH